MGRGVPTNHLREVVPKLGGAIQGEISHTIRDLPLGAIGRDAYSPSMELQEPTKVLSLI